VEVLFGRGPTEPPMPESFCDERAIPRVARMVAMSGVATSVSVNFAAGRGCRWALVGRHGSRQALSEIRGALERWQIRAQGSLLVWHFHSGGGWRDRIVACLRLELQALGRRARRVCQAKWRVENPGSQSERALPPHPNPGHIRSVAMWTLGRVCMSHELFAPEVTGSDKDGRSWCSRSTREPVPTYSPSAASSASRRQDCRLLLPMMSTLTPTRTARTWNCSAADNHTTRLE
jgi:hypothetical protein